MSQEDNGKQGGNTNSNDKADSRIGDEGACALSEAVKFNTTLTVLDLRGEQQQGRNKQRDTISSHDKAGNRIDKSASALSEALKVNTALTALDLEIAAKREDHDKESTTPTKNEKADNRIRVEGACALSEALKINNTLTSLNLGCEAIVRQWQARHNINRNNKAVNRIEEGASEVSEALKVNTTLKSLVLTCGQRREDHDKQGNTNKNDKADKQIRDEGACALSEALKVNTTLTALYLGCETTVMEWHARQ